MAKENAKRNDVVDLDFSDLDEKQPAPAVSDKPKRNRKPAPKKVTPAPEPVVPVVPTFTVKQVTAILDSANLIAKELVDGAVTEDTLKTTYAKALRIAMKTHA